MFITFEGIEGVGKTTHISFVADLLRQKGIPYLLTREPGGTLLGEELRHILLKDREDSVVPLAELLLMFAARAQHLETVIKPAVADGQWVLCDRFLDATYAYQGGGRKMLIADIDVLANLVVGDFHPDLTFIFDADPELGLSRALRRSNTLDRFEKENIEFFERVRKVYLDRSKSHAQYHIIDASQSLEAIQQELTKILNEYKY